MLELGELKCWEDKNHHLRLTDPVLAVALAGARLAGARRGVGAKPETPARALLRRAFRCRRGGRARHTAD